MHLVGFILRTELNVNELMNIFLYMHPKRKILSLKGNSYQMEIIQPSARNRLSVHAAVNRNFNVQS